MPIFNKGGKKSFHMNPQMGKALIGGPTDSAAPSADAGLETPAEESAEPTMITCPSCGDTFELEAKPIEKPEGEEGADQSGEDEDTYGPNGEAEQ